MRSILLVGFMASGKTTVGPVLAARLGRPFVDLDRLIEERRGVTIGEFIAVEGEESFRQCETATLREVLESGAGVIAPGGGAITRAENRRVMATRGVMVWLDAPFELCWERIKQDPVVRPLASDEASARTRYEQRRPLYEESAVHLPVTAEMAPEEIAARIITALSSL